MELETLPKKLRKLINLRRISITTKQSVLPESDIASLCLLEELNICNCDNLESPFGGVELLALRFLRIITCKNLKSLPLDIHHFPQLKDFSIFKCDNFEWSSVHEDMNSVLKLKLLVFFMVVNIPHSLQAYANTLQTLVFWFCLELEALPEWVLNMTCLKFLHIYGCPKLMSLPNEIHRLKPLKFCISKVALYCTENTSRKLESIGTKYLTSSILESFDRMREALKQELQLEVKSLLILLTLPHWLKGSSIYRHIAKFLLIQHKNYLLHVNTHL
ncbi:hypothetical protein PIB30_088499 [Stylosanthes scabra]|uniref:Uncharacterized protein n=1 Tax=Stylosanthes scabra TaxID=79078 RepID=A0ABU6USM4_9FABA|nr:hypothetical protein [Stylosanthes scabra]